MIKDGGWCNNEICNEAIKEALPNNGTKILNSVYEEIMGMTKEEFMDYYNSTTGEEPKSLSDGGNSMTEYKIVKADSTEYLELIVHEAIANHGWEPIGGMVVIGYKRSNTYAQTMIRILERKYD